MELELGGSHSVRAAPEGAAEVRAVGVRVDMRAAANSTGFALKAILVMFLNMMYVVICWRSFLCLYEVKIGGWRLRSGNSSRPECHASGCS